MPAWEKGVARVWESPNWGDTVPLRHDGQGNLVPVNVRVLNKFLIIMPCITAVRLLTEKQFCLCFCQREPRA